jgi:hypothetical protein
LALLAVVLALFETASTTGYIALAVMLCLLLIHFNPFAKREFHVQPSFLRGWMAITLTSLSIAVAAIVAVPSLSRAVYAETVEKSEGMSFVSRVLVDANALALFANTYGLGVGLGSNRPSSLIATLYTIIRQFPGRWAPSVLQASFWSLMGMLVAQSIGIPDLNRPVLWALFIVAVAQLNAYRIATQRAQPRTA